MRYKYYPTGTGFPDIFSLHLILGYPEITTNILLEEKAQQVPLQPLALLKHTTPKPYSQVSGHLGGYQDPADKTKGSTFY